MEDLKDIEARFSEQGAVMALHVDDTGTEFWPLPVHARDLGNGQVELIIGDGRYWVDGDKLAVMLAALR